MARKLLNQVRVASPCHVAWSEMQGDDRTRYCCQCKHNVFNLSEMTEKEAEAFVREATGRTCVRFYQRADGTVMTRNCPVGLSAVRRRFAIGLLTAAALFVSAFGLATKGPARRESKDDSQARSTGLPDGAGYWDSFSNWLLAKPPEEERYVMGVMPMPMPPSPGPSHKGP